jgi:hypothetical protein
MIAGKYLLLILWLGDILTLGLVTILGFASHGELAEAGPRILTTFLPLCVAWVIVAWPNKILHLTYAFHLRHLWRPAWAILLAAPLAGFIRAWVLGNRPIIPVFILVLMGVSLVAILMWRMIFHWLFREKFVE